MIYYRIYTLDADDEHIIDVNYFHADTDAAAVIEVESRDLRAASELWNQGRKIMSFARRSVPAGEIACTL